MQLRQNTAQNGKGSDGQSGTNEERIGTKRHVLQGALDAELVIEAPGDSDTETEGDNHAGEAHTKGNAPVAAEHASINFEADEEQEKEQAEVCNVGEDGHRGGGEDVLLEAGDAHHDRGAQDDAADDLCDDTGLAEPRERVVQEAAEDDDDACLHDEEGNGIFGVVVDGIEALENAALRPRARGGGGGGRCRCRHGGAQRRRRWSEWGKEIKESLRPDTRRKGDTMRIDRNKF